jgi:hypothetical protein
VVDRVPAQEVHRADHVVEGPCLEQARDSVLTPSDEVRLDPEPQRRAGHELAVLIEVIDRLLLP